MKTKTSSPHRLQFRRRLRSLAVFGAAAISMAQSVFGQLIYTEDFNTDGEASGRYTTRGRGIVLLTVEGNQEPSYWAHSSDVTKAGEVVGVVVPAAARRAALTFQSGVPEALMTLDGLKLIDNTIKWLTGDTKGKVIISPTATGEADLVLSTRLTAAGYTVADDDTSAGLPDAATVALAISTSGAITPTRFTRYGAPVLSFNASNHDDELLTSIGASNSSFDPGEVTIVDPSHPIAAGLPKTFKFVTAEVGLDTVGTTLPENAKVIATYKFLNPDTGVEETRPLLVVVEKGDGLLGGAFKGFEGAGFWAGADMNEPTITPDCCASAEDPRQLTLKAVNVAGKKDLRVTIALAATDIDFENSDFLRVMIDPDGAGPAEFSQLVNFTPPTANDKFFTDPDGKNRLGAIFRDVEFKIPDGATDLVVRLESISTFFNEIVGFDNIRIHSGPLAAAPPPATVGPVSVQDPSHVVGSGDKAWSYLVVEGESYASETDSAAGVGFTIADDSGAITSFGGKPILAKDTTASGKKVLFMQNAARHGDKATYQMKFTKAGTYYLYMRFSMFESGVNETSYLNEDSFFLPPDFGKDPQTDWPLIDAGGQNGGYTEGCCGAAGYLFIPEKGGGGVRVQHTAGVTAEGDTSGREYWEGNFHWNDLISSQFLNPDTQGVANVRRKYEVTADQVGKTLTWTISNREPGTAVDLWLFSTNPDLMDQYSQAELNQVILKFGDGATPTPVGKLEPATATFYINTPDTINNGQTESIGVAVAANGNVVVGWEDDGEGLKNQAAVWTLFDSNGKGLTKEVTFTTTQGAETLTSKFLAYFRADKSPVAGNNAWGPKVKANLFGEGIGMGGTAYSLGLEIPELGPVNLQANGEAGDFPAVQLLNNDGSPVNVLVGVTDAYADREGDIRIADWDYLSNGNIVIVGESRQRADLVDVYKGAEPQTHAIYRIVDPTGKEITPVDKVSEVAEKAEIWHGVGVTKNGFAVRFASATGGGTVRLFDNAGKPITGNIDLATLAGAGAEAAGAGGRGDGAGFHGNGNDAYVAIGASGVVVQVTVIGADGKLRYTRNVAEGANIASVGRVDAAIDEAGNVLAVFPAKATADGSVSLIYGRLLDPTGKPLTEVFLVSETEVPGKATADATDTRVAMRGGVAAVVWESKNQGTGDPSVVATRFFKFGSAVVGGEKPTIASLKVEGANLVLSWTGGQGPFKVQRRDDIASGNWTDVATVTERTAAVPVTGNAGFFRVTAQ